MCSCIEAYRCTRCGLCTACTHERAHFSLERRLKRCFYVDMPSAANAGLNEVEVTEYWVHYHPWNGCWKILATEPLEASS